MVNDCMLIPAGIGCTESRVSLSELGSLQCPCYSPAWQVRSIPCRIYGARSLRQCMLFPQSCARNADVMAQCAMLLYEWPCIVLLIADAASLLHSTVVQHLCLCQVISAGRTTRNYQKAPLPQQLVGAMVLCMLKQKSVPLQPRTHVHMWRCTKPKRDILACRWLQARGSLGICSTPCRCPGGAPCRAGPGWHSQEYRPACGCCWTILPHHCWR